MFLNVILAKFENNKIVLYQSSHRILVTTKILIIAEVVQTGYNYQP